MQLGGLAAQLDRTFRIHQHAEPDGWDFALSPAAKADLLSWAPSRFAELFNGLIPFKLAPEQSIERVYCLVFPEQSLVQSVIDQERARGFPGAVILTHHPLDMATAGAGFAPIPSQQLRELADSSVAMYVLHAALDCHDEISTSRALADALGLRFVRAFAPYVGGDCGVIGVQPPEPFERFSDRVCAVCEIDSIPADQIRRGSGMVSRVGIVAGGGDNADYMTEAETLGCDTYLAGHWLTQHAGAWCDQNRATIRAVVGRSGMNYLSASHDGSELVVFRDNLVPLLERWGVQTVLIRQADHWR